MSYQDEQGTKILCQQVLRNIDEANASKEQYEIHLTYPLKRTGDPLPPSNVKAILHDSFCVCLKARIILLALSSSDCIDGRKARHLLDRGPQNFFDHASEATFRERRSLDTLNERERSDRYG
jgi:hypothetical protein